MLSFKKGSPFLQTTSVFHRFQALSAPSMIKVYETIECFFTGCVSFDILSHIQMRLQRAIPPVFSRMSWTTFSGFEQGHTKLGMIYTAAHFHALG